MEYLKNLIDTRQKAWHEIKATLDAAAAEKRELTVDEQVKVDAAMLDIDRRDDQIKAMEKSLAENASAEARAVAIEAAMAAAPELRAAARITEARVTDSDILRKLALGEIRSHSFEKRILNTTDDNELVPVEFLARVQELMLYTGPMLNESFFTRINTSNGRDIRIPVEATRPTGTATAESATFAESEGTFNELTLRAWKYGTLVRVSRELIDDSAIDLVEFIGRQVATSSGYRCEQRPDFGYWHRSAAGYRRGRWLWCHWWHGCIGRSHVRQPDRPSVLG